MFHAEDPQILGATIQNLVARAAWHPGFLDPTLQLLTILTLLTVNFSFELMVVFNLVNISQRDVWNEGMFTYTWHTYVHSHLMFRGFI
jgi:hypothetical protein